MESGGDEGWGLPRSPNWRFLWWAAPCYLAATAVAVVVAMRRTDGRLVYLLDDPAIHLSIARQVADHGTWGVAPGHFESASSSPVWTLLLTVVRVVAPFMFTAAPLILSMVAGVWALAAIGVDQQVLRPGLRRPVDVVAVAVLVVVVLLLPALTMLGMEHVLHVALVASTMALFARRFAGRPLRWPAVTPYLLLAVATLVRFETAFVALGLAVATVVAPGGLVDEPNGRTSWWTRVRAGALIGLSSAAPLVGFAVVNRALGQGWLPNSVLAKGQIVSGEAGIGPIAVWSRLTVDWVVAGCLVLGVVCALAGWRRDRRVVGPAIALVVAIGCHVLLADVGWFDRYQAYLIAAGVLVGLTTATALAGPAREASQTGTFASWSLVLRWSGAAVVAALALLGGAKASLSLDIGDAAADTFEQRYQAALFVDRYYDDEPIATSELGYISLFHDGPITDLYGLGDHRVLEERRRTGGHPSKRYWATLAAERDVDVVIAYPYTLLLDTPDEWILVGEWVLPRPSTTAFQPNLQFWATTPDEVGVLQRHLREFEGELPAGVTTNYDQLASYRAEQMSGP